MSYGEKLYCLSRRGRIYDEYKLDNFTIYTI